MPSIRTIAAAVTDWFYWPAAEVPADPPETDPAGAAGTALIGGWPDFKEKKAQLATLPERMRTFDDAKANVAIIGTGLRNFYTLVDGVTWRVMPDVTRLAPDEDRDALEDLCRRVEARWAKLNVKLAVIARRQCAAKIDGAAIQAWTAVEDEDGGLRIGRCDVRPVGTIERWVRDEFGELVGVFQRDPESQQELWIPRSRMIYSVDDQLTDNPAGMGLMRHAMTDVRVMGVYEQLEGTGYQTDMRGLPVGYAPLAKLRQMVKDGLMTEEEYRQRKGTLDKILSNHVKTGNLSVLLDSAVYRNPDGTLSSVKEYGIELVRGDQGSKYEAIKKAIEHRELRIARLFGQEHLFIGSQGNSGGYGQSKDRSKSFGQMVNSTVISVGSDLDRDLLRVELELMGEDPDSPISCTPDASNLRDVTEAVDVVWKLSQAQPIQPGDPIINHVRALAKLPPAPEFSEETRTALMQTQGMLPAPPPPVDPNKVDEKGNLRQAPRMASDNGGSGNGAAAKAADELFASRVRGSVDGVTAVDQQAAEASAYERARALHEQVTKAVGALRSTGKGVFVGFFPPSEVARDVSLVGGADETALHVTLCYLGKGLAEDVVGDVVRTVQRLAASMPVGPTLRVTGSARFAGPRAHVLLVEGANAFQSVLASTLRARGLPVDATYGFNGHLTLAYENRALIGFAADDERRMISERAAEIAGRGVSWVAGEVVVAAGIERVAFPFGG